MARRQTRVLTDVQLRKLIEAAQPTALSDGDGLTFTLSAGGTAAWVLRYRHGGRRREVTLGKYPDLGLSAARKMAAALRVEVAAGKDLAAEKQRERAARNTAWTVRELARDFQKKVVPGLAPSSAVCVWSYIQSDLLPRFGASVARDVTPNDAHDWLERLATQRGYWPARNARNAAILVFKHGRAARVVQGNPFAEIPMNAVAPRPNVRARVALSDDELRVFVRGLETLPVQDASLAELLLLTGVRVGEALNAEWCDLHLDVGEWRIPRAKIKVRKRMRDEAFVVPLPPSAVEIFRRLEPLACGSRWVFPAMVAFDVDLRPMDHERALDRLKRYVETLGEACRAITFHDCCRSLKIDQENGVLLAED